MGLHFGEPVFVEKPSSFSSQRTVYYGSVIETAKRVSQVAHGGQIVATDEAWQQFHQSLVELDSPEVFFFFDEQFK